MERVSVNEQTSDESDSESEGNRGGSDGHNGQNGQDPEGEEVEEEDEDCLIIEEKVLSRVRNSLALDMSPDINPYESVEDMSPESPPPREQFRESVTNPVVTVMYM
jgi:hypothetical protein